MIKNATKTEQKMLHDESVDQINSDDEASP
jgi:hypothetical protein